MSSLKKEKTHLSDVVSTITDRKKVLETIIFHSFSILLSVIILFLLSQVYLIFLPCLKALLWALLCGSALHPYKVKLNNLIQNWLENLDQKNRSFCFGFIMVPWQVVANMYWILITFVNTNKLLFVLFHFRFQICDFLKLISEIGMSFLVSDKFIISGLVLAGISFQISFSMIGGNTFSNLLKVLPSLFFLLTLYLLHNFFQLLSSILFVLFLLISIIGFLSSVISFKRDSSNVQEINWIISQFQKLFVYIQNRFNRQAKLDQSDGVSLNEINDIEQKNKSFGDIYVSLMFSVFAFAIIESMNLSNVLLVVFSLHLLVKKSIEKLNKNFFIILDSYKFQIYPNFLLKRLEQDFLFKFLTYFFIKGDQIMKKSLGKCLNISTSIGLFLIVALTVLLFSALLSIKIYGELFSVIYFVRNEVKNIDYLKDTLNVTLSEVTNVEYLNELLKQNFLINDRWNFGKEDNLLLSRMLPELSNNIMIYLNSSRVLPYSEDNNQTTSNDIFNATMLFWSDLKNLDNQLLWRLISSSDWHRNHRHIYVAMFKSFASLLYTFIFIILSGSTLMLAFLLNFIVFILALFYLLNMSDQRYKPIDFINRIIAFSETSPEQNLFSRYVEEVVNSIFAATIKISAFYGFYTWLIHSLFGIQVCCIPSVFAALLAAVPILTAYWASVPACLYLYYFDADFPLIKSLLMLLLAITPSFIVDSTIYSNIKKAAHPYLTGLAITCGVFYYGVEGALFGPLWLCLLIIILNMCYSSTKFHKNMTNIFSP